MHVISRFLLHCCPFRALAHMHNSPYKSFTILPTEIVVQEHGQFQFIVSHSVPKMIIQLTILVNFSILIAVFNLQSYLHLSGGITVITRHFGFYNPTSESCEYNASSIIYIWYPFVSSTSNQGESKQKISTMQLRLLAIIAGIMAKLHLLQILLGIYP